MELRCPDYLASCLLENRMKISSVQPTRMRYRVLAAACSVAVVAYLHRVGFGKRPAPARSRPQRRWLAFGYFSDRLWTF